MITSLRIRSLVQLFSDLFNSSAIKYTSTSIELSQSTHHLLFVKRIASITKLIIDCYEIKKSIIEMGSPPISERQQKIKTPGKRQFHSIMIAFFCMSPFLSLVVFLFPSLFLPPFRFNNHSRNVYKILRIFY